MSYHLEVDGMAGPQVGSNTGWSQLSRWLGTLDADKFPALKDLADLGHTERPATLREELARAIESNPSGDADVETSARDLLSSLADEDSDHAEIVGVSNGIDPS